MTKKALITGITGQDGSYLAELLLSKNYEVTGLIRRHSSPNFWRIEHLLDKIELVSGDITDQVSVNNIIKRHHPNEVYNLAAQSFVETSFLQPNYTCQVDGIGTLNVLDAIKENAPHAKFYQASTSELFGTAKESPQHEHTPFHPRSPYGISKLFSYWTAINYREAYNIFACNGILFNHESPRRGVEFVSRKITHGIARIVAGKQDKLKLGNLDAKRDWGYAKEYVEAMWLMLQQKEPDEFVIATGETHSVREFCQLAFEYAGITNWENHVEIDKKYFRPAEVHLLCGDASKAKRELNWEAKTKFKELVKLMMDAELAPQIN